MVSPQSTLCSCLSASKDSFPPLKEKRQNLSSVMAINDECKLKFLELKMKRTPRFIIFKIDDKANKIIVEKVGQPILSYKDFAANLPADECRYGIYDVDFVTQDNCQKSKILFTAWYLDTSTVISKVLYAISMDIFKRALDGIQVVLQAIDSTDMGINVIRGRVK